MYLRHSRGEWHTKFLVLERLSHFLTSFIATPTKILVQELHLKFMILLNNQNIMSIEMSQLKFDWIKVVPRVSLLLLPRLSLSFSRYRTRREERAWNIGMT